MEPLLERHAEAMYALFAEPDVWTYLDSSRPSSIEALAVRHRRLESRTSPDGTELWLNWAVISEGALIGYVQATVAAERRISVAYVIGKRHWARGLGTDAVRAMMIFLDRRFPGADFVASVDDRNTASLKLLMRLDFAAYDNSDPRNVQLRRMRPS